MRQIIGFYCVLLTSVMVTRVGYTQIDLVANSTDTTTNCLYDKEFLMQELSFIKYLTDNEEFENVIESRNNLQLLHCNKFPAINDSLHYYAGWSAYRIKDLSFATSEFFNVGQTSPLYTKSRMYASFCQAYGKQPKKAIETIYNTTNINGDSEISELKNFQLAGNYLLSRDYTKYDSIARLLDTNNYLIKNELLKLSAYKSDLVGFKKKSKFLAGMFSAIVPGSGKFYAGYKGQAIAAAIPTILFGAVATEQYFKSGPQSFQFISFASIFSIFYVGNIWGSVISVRTYRDDVYNKIDNGILVDMHIPLRRFFK